MQEIIRYQEIDFTLRKMERELNNSASYRGRAQMQQLIKADQATLLKLENTAANLTNQYNKATQLYNEFVSALETLQKKLAEVKNEDLASLANEVKSLAQKGETLENNISAMAGRINATNREIDSILRNIKVNSEKLKAYREACAGEIAKIEPEVKRLKEELIKQKAKVDPKLLAKYAAKKENNIFPVFVKENRGSCGGCRMGIPAGRLSELKNNGMVECENCGRIIYVDEAK